jgi:hypothetical protein
MGASILRFKPFSIRKPDTHTLGEGKKGIRKILTRNVFAS